MLPNPVAYPREGSIARLPARSKAARLVQVSLVQPVAVMIVDAHVHIFPREMAAQRERLAAADPYFAELYQPPLDRMATAEDLLASMDAAGFDVAVVAGFGWRDQSLCREHNAYMLEAMSSHSGRIIALATVNPSAPGAGAVLEDGLAAGLAGIGELMPDGPGYRIAQPDVLHLLGEAAAAHDVPILLHVSEPVGHRYPGKGTVAAAEVLAFAEHFPQVPLVCAHLGGGLPFFELMPEVRRALGNVYYDTAAWPFLYTDLAFQVVDLAAPGKLLFATDYPLVNQQKALGRVRRLGLPAPVEEAILGANALQVYARRREIGTQTVRSD